MLETNRQIEKWLRKDKISDGLRIKVERQVKALRIRLQKLEEVLNKEQN